eukprot:15481382-Alexandrium_andersonii.AAC.1
MAIRETKSPTTTQYISEGYMFVTVGNGQTRENSGVGFVIDPKVRRAIRHMDCKGSSLALLALASGPRDIVILSAYAPRA